MDQQLVLVILADVIGAVLSLGGTWLWHHLQASDLDARPSDAILGNPDRRFSSRRSQLYALMISSDVGIMLLVAAPLQFIFPIIQQDPREQMTLIMSFDNMPFLSTGFAVVGARHTHDRWKSLIFVALIISAVMVTTILVYISKDIEAELQLDIIMFVILFVTFTMGVGGLASYVFNRGQASEKDD